MYQSKRYSERLPAMIKAQMLLALGGGLLSAGQALLIVLQGNILCFNDGCEIVETLTTVPPIAFNLSGSLFFLTVFLALWLGARGVRGWPNLARILLLAGMTAEGVLISFQHWVAEAYCWYCLVIFGFVAVLNLLMGWRQVLEAAAVFAAVLLAFASLQFIPHSASADQGMENGVYGRLDRGGSEKSRLFLFFSSTCPHCEDVIASLDASFDCSLNFNPIDELKAPPMENLAIRADYSPEVNRRYLRTFGVSEIPVLAVKTPEEIRILKGGQAIQDFLNGSCRKNSQEGQLPQESSGVSEGSRSVLPFVSAPAGVNEDACSVDEACETIPGAGDGR